MTCDADAGELKAEPDHEESGPPVVLEVVRPEDGGTMMGLCVRLRRLAPWYAGQRSSSRCTGNWSSIPLDDADIECLIQGLRLVTPCAQRIDRLIDLLEQIRDRGPTGHGAST
jgi:hypothetical protein